MTPDEVWLAHAGQHGWIILTKDDNIRRHQLALSAIIRNRVRNLNAALRYTPDLRYTSALASKHVCFDDVNASHSPSYGASLMYSRWVKKPVIVPGNA